MRHDDSAQRPDFDVPSGVPPNHGGLFRWLGERVNARRDWLHPILVLTGDPSPTRGIQLWLDQATNPVPHASVITRPTDTVATLLHRLADGLTESDAVGGAPTFPRFRLLERLQAEDVSAVPAAERRRELARRLRRPPKGTANDQANPATDSAREIVRERAGTVPALVLSLLLLGFPLLIKTLRDRTARRWLLHQRYLTRPGTNFAAFALRLTRNGRSADSPDVDLLLVNAFLQDLRSSYTGSRLRWTWRRRTACPVVLLENCEPGSAGEELLRVLNIVRNKDQRGDPLIVIAHATSSSLRSQSEIEDADHAWRSRRLGCSPVGAVRRTPCVQTR